MTWVHGPLRMDARAARRMLRLVRGSLAAAVLLAVSSRAAEIYVSPLGSDGDPGTASKPVRTLARARDLLRLEKGGPAGCTVHLLPGIYRLDETLAFDGRDSGTAARPVTWSGAGANRVFVTGGPEIPDRARRPVPEDDPIRRRLPPAVRGPVYRIDLRAVGVSDVGEYGPRGFGRPYVPAPLELFIDDHALRVAQWPNRGEPGIPITRVIDPGSDPRDGDDSGRGGTFLAGTSRIDRWTHAGRFWIHGYFAYGFADDTVEVAKVDAAAGTITTRQPTLYSFRSGKPFIAWRALDLPEELDEPGEYYADPDSGRLYFIPPRGVDMSRARVRVSVLKEPLLAFEGASDIRVEGITFEDTRGIGVYIERGGNVVIRGCTLRDIGIVAVCIGRGVEPVPGPRNGVTSRPASRMIGSLYQHLYDNTAFNREGGRRNGVIGCDIHDIGAGGVSLGGGDRASLSPAGNFVEDCDIHDFNRLDASYRAGVNVDGVGNVIRGNRIHDAPGGAVYLHGNDQLVAGNEIFRCATDVDDQAAIYLGRDPSEQGDVIRGNFFHDNGARIGPHGTQCVYIDDGACGVLVAGNLFYRNTGDAIKINGGFDNVISRNVFIENGGLFFNAGGGVKDWLKEQASALERRRLREAVDVLAPPYSLRYPRLVRTLTDPPDAPRANDFDFNLFIRSGRLGADGARGDRFIRREGNRYEDGAGGDGAPPRASDGAGVPRGFASGRDFGLAGG